MTDKSAIARALLAKDPDWEYGELLPIATTKGKIRPAIPDILRTPMQSWVDIMDSMGTGNIQTHEGTEEMMPDIINVTPMGAGTAVGSNMIRRGALSEEMRWAPYPVSYAKGVIGDAVAPIAERLAQRRERAARPGRPPPQDHLGARPQIDPGRRVAPPPRPPQRSMDVDGLLSEIDELSKLIASNGDEISQMRYSRNRERLRQNPDSLQSRLERGPESYSPPPDRMMPRPRDVGPLKTPKLFAGEQPMSRDQIKRMQMAHGEFRASIDAPQAAFRAGEISEERFNEAAKAALIRAARGNGIDPRYLAQQIAKDQRRDPKGWALTFPDKQ